ncbi:hypothetical protein DIPPA_07546 [Diplonema papillatum]|nr:hypothetical protein DIPPA_07546 [Diplonema papillatum]
MKLTGKKAPAARKTTTKTMAKTMPADSGTKTTGVKSAVNAANLRPKYSKKEKKMPPKRAKKAKAPSKKKAKKAAKSKLSERSLPSKLSQSRSIQSALSKTVANIWLANQGESDLKPLGPESLDIVTQLLFAWMEHGCDHLNVSKGMTTYGYYTIAGGAYHVDL